MATHKRSTPTKDLPKPPILEWITAAVGLAIVLTAFVLVLAQAFGGADEPPDLRASAGEARRTPAGWALEVTVANHGDQTAAAVMIEGRLGREIATAELDYVPAHGEATASLRFDNDPRRGPELKVLGWREP